MRVSDWARLGLAIASVAVLAHGRRAAAGEQKLAPIRLRLPLPVFYTGGWPIRDTEHLEKSSAKPRPPFLAPVGTTNVALGRPVTSSDLWPFAEDLAPITNGDKGGRKGSIVELRQGHQWVQVDLGAPHVIYAIVFWRPNGLKLVYHDVAVQVAHDRDCIQGVRTLFNNDYDNSLGLGVGRDKEYRESHEGRLVDAKGARARYVRIHSNGNVRDRLNRYLEVEVYGKPQSSASPRRSAQAHE